MSEKTGGNYVCETDRKHVDEEYEAGTYIAVKCKTGKFTDEKHGARRYEIGKPAGGIPVSRVDLWQYCTWEHCKEMLLSFHLLGENDWSEDKILACLYALGNHGEKHYKKIRIPKKSGGFRILLAPDPLLKYVQKNILHHVLEGFSVSDQATAYRKKGNPANAVCGCVENASLHR